jgi:hypothetical protein
MLCFDGNTACFSVLAVAGSGAKAGFRLFAACSGKAERAATWAAAAAGFAIQSQ